MVSTLASVIIIFLPVLGLQIIATPTFFIGLDKAEDY